MTLGWKELQPVAVGYVRRSKRSDAKSVSLEARREAVRRYCQEHGWRLGAVVEHDGVSGRRRSRFAALDAAVKAHMARFVVAYHVDRAARDLAGLLDWMKAASKRGVRVHVAGRGEIETRTSAGFLAVSVEGMVAEHYARIIGEKTRDALARLKASGKRWNRVAPYGARFENGRAVPDSTERQVVFEVARLRAEGRSLRQVSVTLAARGITNRDGRPFHPMTLARMAKA